MKVGAASARKRPTTKERKQKHVGIPPLPDLPRGNCYVTAEALFHLMGGKAAGWKPMFMRWAGDSHWFLQHETGIILDPVAAVFVSLHGAKEPNYSKAKGKGFLTKAPSRRTTQMMRALAYGIPVATAHEMNDEFHRGRHYSPPG